MRRRLLNKKIGSDSGLFDATNYGIISEYSVKSTANNETGYFAKGQKNGTGTQYFVFYDPSNGEITLDSPISTTSVNNEGTVLSDLTFGSGDYFNITEWRDNIDGLDLSKVRDVSTFRIIDNGNLKTLEGFGVMFVDDIGGLDGGLGDTSDTVIDPDLDFSLVFIFVNEGSNGRRVFTSTITGSSNNISIRADGDVLVNTPDGTFSIVRSSTELDLNILIVTHDSSAKQLEAFWNGASEGTLTYTSAWNDSSRLLMLGNNANYANVLNGRIAYFGVADSIISDTSGLNTELSNLFPIS